MVRKLLVLLAILLIVGAVVGWWGYNTIFSDNINAEEEKALYIPSGAGFDTVIDSLEEKNLLKSLASFERVASWMKYNNETVPSGRYIIAPGMSNKALISKLRSGNQDAVNLTFHTARNLEELSGDLTKRLELDSLQLLDLLNKPESYTSRNLTKETFISMFIPNTYQVYWDITGAELLDRLHTEYDKFWADPKRKERLEQLKMSRAEVYTLASIVEKESAYKPERPTIAGLYLNRLERGIPLQADPTVVFAVGDFTLRRVLNKHLEVENPYNTYLYPGLPPGPISLASINSIDAVLNAEDNTYLYMCAKPGFNSEHAFSRTLSEHNRNAQIYRKWLNNQGIK